MISWILILTISGSTVDSTVDSTTVDRIYYKNEQGCAKAVIYWNNKKPKKFGKITYNYSATCIPHALEIT